MNKQDIKAITVLIFFFGLFVAFAFGVAMFANRASASVAPIRVTEKATPHELTVEGIESATKLHNEAKRLGLRTSQNLTTDYCDLSVLPINVLFANYTINQQGQIVQDGGWTQQERDFLGEFLCKSLPLIKRVYGAPFKYYDLTYVKNLQLTGSSVFYPSLLEIHFGGALPPLWYPQLLVHELIHAWRWQWCITCDHSTAYIFNPELSGFEEGFAQGVSYQVMNAYTSTYGEGDPHVQFAYWLADTEWDYDFRNDRSMTTENYWSEGGGTQKFFERYEMGAAAIIKIGINTPNFAKDFNRAYYFITKQYIDGGDPNHVFTRQEIIDIMELVSPTVEGKPLEEWINDQRIFDQEYEHGKKVWFWKGYFNLANPVYIIQFVETFPSGTEWAHYIQALGDYLYHRLNGTLGNMDFVQAWNNVILASHQVEMERPSWWPPPPPCGGVGCSYDIGIGYDQIEVYQTNPSQIPYIQTPIQFQQPTTKGLYRFDVSFNNPHYVAPPNQPLYGITYDGTQQSAEDEKHTLLGLTAQEYDKRIIGGIVGAQNGSVTVSHNKVAGVSDICQVTNGLFMCAGQPEWYGLILNGSYPATKLGTFKFVFIPEGSVQSYEARRIVDIGFASRHQFLLDINDMIPL